MQYLITGAAGFIGSFLCHKLAKEGNKIIAIDNFSNYYDVGLKNNRVKELLEPLNIDVVNLDIVDDAKFDNLVSKSKPDVVINLAAQAGVRLPLKETDKYVNSNLVGFSNVLRSTVNNKVPHFLYASSSSVYGDKAAIPYIESEQNLHPNSFYGATKLANELLTPTLIQNSSTAARGLRFFTVYGPWGRPDMALFLFTKAIVDGKPINVFNNGEMSRDFTYIDDIISGIQIVLDNPPLKENESNTPYKISNIGNGAPETLGNFILSIEESLGIKAIKNMLPMQPGDVPQTWADIQDLNALGYKSITSIKIGVKKFIDWYVSFYNVDNIK